MPRLSCPLGDFTSRSEETSAAAGELADHLLKAHCKSPLPKLDASSLEEVTDQVGDLTVRAEVQGPVDADVRIERR